MLQKKHRLVTPLQVISRTMLLHNWNKGAFDTLERLSLRPSSFLFVQHSLAALPAVYKRDVDLIRFWDDNAVKFC